MDKLKKFWEECDTDFAHITLGRTLNGYDNITKYWERSFISMISLENKSVIEYGIGGGYLGKYLLEDKNISKYTGIDISERSLQDANARLIDHKSKVQLMNTDLFYSKFNETADFFITQAVIQHFPNQKYLETFLEKVESLKCNELILQIRSNSETSFMNNTIKEEEYYKEHDIVYACLTNSDFICKKLKLYRLEYKSEIDSTSRYQFLYFKKI